MIFYYETALQDSAIGKIPKGWTIKTAQEIGEVVTGVTPSTFVEEYWNGDYPFVTPTDITKQKYVEKTERKVSRKGLEKGRILPKDAVLVTCIASIGKIALAFEGCLTNQQINAIICKNGMNPHFVYYAIGFRKSVLQSWAGKTTSPIVKKSLFEKFPIPVPINPFEQQAIVGVLGVVDSAIELADRVIAKTERLKNDVLQRLMTKGIKHIKFKTTLVGEIPDEWAFEEFSQYCKSSAYGPRFGAELYSTEGKIGTIRTTDFTEDSEIKFSTVPMANLSEGDMKGHLLKTGDLLISRSGTVGLSAVFPEHKGLYIPGAYLIRFRMRESISPKWLKYYLDSPAGAISIGKLSEGGVQKNIKGSAILKLKIPVPTIDEQKQIVAIISTFDTKLHLEKRSKEKFVRIKQGMMDLLLTGKVRIKVD